MTRYEMSLEIAQQASVKDVGAKQIVQATLNAMIEALAREGRLRLRDFGVFDVRVGKARNSRFS